MHVVFGIFGQVVVDHVAYALDVQAAPGHVGGDQHGQLAALELGQGFAALDLGDLAGKHAAGDARLAQALVQPAHLVAAVGEHDHARGILGAQQIDEYAKALFAAGQIDALIHAVRGHLLGFDVHSDRPGRPLARQVDDVLRKGRREQQGLAIVFARGLTHDTFYLGDKTHIQHAVGLVEDEHLDMIEMQVAPARKVQEPARRGHHQIDELAIEALELLLVIHAPDQCDGVETRVFAEVRGIRGDLHHQFARRRDNQRTRFTQKTLPIQGVSQQVIKDRDQKSGRFTRARLRLADGVVTRQRMGQDLGLNR